MLVANKKTWIWFLLIKSDLLLSSNKYTKIKIIEENIGIWKIKTSYENQGEKDNKNITSNIALIDSLISLKGDN